MQIKIVKVLALSDSLIVGKGANRICYQHPLDHEKCIKIPYPGHQKAQILECKYLNRLESDCHPLKHIVQYYGEVNTNRGKGYVYELVRDFDHTISHPLSDYLSIIPTIYIELGVILDSLAELKKYLRENKIIVRNLRPYNILLKRTNYYSVTAIVIDNLGHHNALPHFSDHIAYLAHKDLDKKWKKFETMLENKSRL